MKIVFFGTSCAVPTAENSSTSLCIEHDNVYILIDSVGHPLQSLFKAKVPALSFSAVILTHFHPDHVSGFPPLLQALDLLGRKKELVIVSNDFTRDKVLKLLDLLKMQPRLLGFPLRFEDVFSSSELEISLKPGHHSIPTSMVLIKNNLSRILYTSDTHYSRDVSEAASGCSVLIHEATCPHSKIGRFGKDGHSSSLQAGITASESGVSTLFLCHVCTHLFSDSASITEEAKKAFNGRIIFPDVYKWYQI